MLPEPELAENAVDGNCVELRLATLEGQRRKKRVAIPSLGRLFGLPSGSYDKNLLALLEVSIREFAKVKTYLHDLPVEQVAALWLVRKRFSH